MFLNRPLRNSNGSAQLVAVMAAAAISSVIMLSNAEMLTTFNNQNRKVVQTNIALDLRKQVEAFMTDVNCRHNFGPTAPGHSALGQTQGQGSGQSGGQGQGGSGDQGQGQGPGGGGGGGGNNTQVRAEPFRDPVSNAPVFVPNTTFDNGVLRYVGWSLTNTSTILRPTNPVHMIVDLNLHLLGADGAPVIRTIKIAAQKVNGVNSGIDYCYAVSTSTADLWTRDSGGNNIYNLNTGNVGMFTTDPAQKLDVVGDMLFTGTLTQNSISNSGATNADANMLVDGYAAIGAPLDPAYRLQVTGTGLVSGNYTSGGVFDTFNLNTLTTASIGGRLTVNGSSTLGAAGASGPRLSVMGPATFSSNQPDPEAIPDFLVGGNASFASPVNSSSSVAIGAPIPGADFSVSGATSITTLLTTPIYTGNSSLCINGNCRTTFATQTCPHGMWQINVDGTVGCSNLSCPAGQLFTGISATGQAVCQPLPFNTCPSGQFIESVNPSSGAITCKDLDPLVQVGNCAGAGRNFVISISNGNATCVPATLLGGPRCPDGQVAIGFNADGVVSCSSPIRGLPRTCTPGQVVVGMNANGTPICGNAFDGVACGANQVARGIASDGSLVCTPVNHLIGGSCPAGGVAVGVSATGGLNCGCPPQVLAWSANGNLCDATLPASPAGAVGATDSDYPTTGTATFTCTTSGWNTTASSPVCNAAVNGACGAAHGGTYTSAPTTDLCASGTATTVNGSGPWTWGCNGGPGGTSTAANACTANLTSDTTGGSCPAGQCCIKHPMVWSGVSGGENYNCAEYYLAPGGTFSSSTMTAGEQKIFQSGYCASGNGPCWGNLTARCESDGSLTRVSGTCQGGNEP